VAKSKLHHTSNIVSHMLSGAAERFVLRQPFTADHGGAAMSPEKLAVLKSLTIRPSSSLAESVLPIVIGLQQGGFVTDSPTGWVATAKGCEVLEQQRAPYCIRGTSPER